MKILKANAGPLTNFEVYDFLLKKGASVDPVKRVMTKLKESELKVFDYLVQTPACNQTRESIAEFTEKCKEFNLAKADVINLINIRPTDPVESAPCIEEDANRMGETGLGELQTMIDTVLPPAPPRPESQMSGEEDNMDVAT